MERKSMRRITVWLFSTVAALVLLFSYRTSTGGTATATPVAAAAAPTGSGKTYKGSVAQTRWGPVQVTITMADGKITDVAVPIYPNGNGRDQQINAYALPTLRQETLTAQSADIDTVSGATVTSDGYMESLQAALDSARS
jgi:uncharacterized protein with FMN-binding domain